MHFLQSEAWQNFQKELGRKTFRQSGEGWEYLAILETGRGNTRLYCPYGPSAQDQRSFEEAMQSLMSLGKRENASFVRIEPTNPKRIDFIKKNGGKKVTYQSLNPERTIIIDLDRPVEDIVAAMTAPNRNYYRNYQKKGINIYQSTKVKDIEIFLGLIKKVAERTGMRPHSDDYFRRQAESLFPAGAAKLFVATYDKTPIAASIGYDSSTTRYYAHAGTDADYAKLHAGNALVARMIIDAKQQGLQQFDLYGIAPKNAPQDHPWSGFTKFKQSYGGTEVDYAGSWDIPLKRLPYFAYRAYQQLYRALR